MTPSLSDAELEIMKVIWAKEGPALFAYLLQALAAKGKTWQKNTLITLLSRLTKKGYVKAEKEGNRNAYTALITESDYQTAQTKNFLSRVYQGSVRGLVANLIQSELLAEEEYEALKRLIEGGEDAE